MPVISLLLSLAAQQSATPAPDTVRAAPSAATAVRAERAPVIDGRGEDDVWRRAEPITDFREWEPTEGAPARFRTEARVAYDAANLYVLIRAFDPHPDSLIRRLERRDTFGPGDRVGFMVDGYHDHRSGFEFWVNAAGVEADIQIFNDREDGAWDGVWDVATTVDSLGWTAEFRVPLSQIRYPQIESPTFGILVMRDIYRYQERTSWPQLRQSQAGLVRQFGEVTGLTGLEAPRRLEAAPYVVARNASVVGTPAGGYGRASFGSAGADLKYRVASNLTLDGTVNPDFGQVEADPSVLNLSYYETFYEERRPFFVAGQGVFQFDVNCNQVNCRQEGLYYSRRIGRPPQLGGSNQQPVRILGAAKLTGQPLSGLSVGFLDAATQRFRGWNDTAMATLEPATNYAALRVKQDLRRGATSIGAMLTAVNRANDAWTAPALARSAYAAAVDFRHRFLKDLYQIEGSFDVSRVAGSDLAMAALQTDNVHLYQRVGSGLPLDSARTVLSGDAEELKFAKVGGRHTNFETAYQRRSAGFEINDLGYLQQADQQSWSTWAGLFDRRETSWYRRLEWNLNWWQNWTSGGLPTEAAYYTHVEWELKNRWGLDVGVSGGGVGAVYCDRCARGGPALRIDPYVAPWIEVEGDDSRALVPSLRVQLLMGDGGRSHTFSLDPGLAFQAGSRLGGEVSVGYERNHNDSQWFGNLTDSTGTHYTFAALSQTTTSLTLRLNYTFTPDVSLQVYAQPFVSKGTYQNLREVSATPRARRYDDRFAAYGDSAFQASPGGFNFKAFQSNVVFRWEYRPGSTLFLVWSQGRQGAAPLEGTGGWTADLRDLFRVHPLDTFLVKVSYWLNP